MRNIRQFIANIKSKYPSSRNLEYLIHLIQTTDDVTVVFSIVIGIRCVLKHI